MRAGLERGVRVLLMVAALAWPAAAAGAEFQVSEVQARLEDGAVLVAARMELDLSEAAETALTKGIPLDILIEFTLDRHRRLLWDNKLGHWTLRAQVKYHALSGLYVVTLQDGSDPKTFSTQRGALKYVGTLTRVSLPVGDTDDGAGRYALWLRVHLDIEALPVPLRPLAYTSTGWHLDSKWTQWTVRPSPAA